ncbi:LADA_0E04324g1_1 [Lachancea dasiensis]|uniref:LADA_0E04324g1_1 n=1 Tax=Lachancea dasiensis TaxID=1072105 RepID=A0A1G4JC87_9SACH|nr:LADA_0E04324g1_1 [Lachancea dasiensis]
MGKGFKLKELLSHQKEIAKLDKKAEAKNAQKKMKDEPIVVGHEDVKKASAVAADAPNDQVEEDDYKSETLSRKERRKLKKLEKKMLSQDPSDAEDDEAESDTGKKLDLEKLEMSESEDEGDEEAEEGDEKDEDNSQQGEAEEEEDVALSDVEFDSDADVVPHQKLTINNAKAINHSLERIQLPWKKHSFQEHQSITSENTTDEGIKDIYDDTERELAFYKQSLDAVLRAKRELQSLKVPFKRPLDYFAEMVKSDEHMDKLKTKLVSEASDRKAREDARKQRQLKKFGKQVQVATLQSRQKEKKETLDRIKSLKQKRKHNEIDDAAFDVGVEEATSEKPEKRHKPNGKRLAKDAKYGQGGMKRFKRKNDANSSSDVSGFSSNKMKGKSSRPGKSRRAKRF